MNVRSILATKGHEVVTTSPERSVLDAARTLVEHDIGALVVTEAGVLLGILSERDVLRLTARSPGALASVRVEDAMTKDVVVAEEADTVELAMDLMTRHRVRHLPIVREGRLRGIVSIGDVVNAVRTQAEVENQQLRDYIGGVA